MTTLLTPRFGRTAQRQGAPSAPAPAQSEADTAAKQAREAIFDWNAVDAQPRPQPFELLDETLRDGLQSPSVKDPELSEKKELLGLMAEVGVRCVNLGLPGAGPQAFADVVELARHLEVQGLDLEACCAARTVEADLARVAEAVQRSGRPIVAYAFIGASPIRALAEDWDPAFVRAAAVKALDFAVRQGLKVAFVTEDTTRTSPQHLEPLYRAAVEHGASRVVLCDTVGHATPAGVRALVGWAKGLTSGLEVEWHGHNDRGLGVSNALEALAAGARRVHGCGLGIGERVGNTAMDLLLLNLKLLGWASHDLSRLVDYVQAVSQACRFPIPSNHPLSGRDAFRTATGVHAAAIAKAMQQGDLWLADRVYSSVPARDFGREQEIEIGPMSGMSNVRFWLSARGLPAPVALCRRVLEHAKAQDRVLSEGEVLALLGAEPGRAVG